MTLLEMLLALAVSSMIGLASFILLDGVTRAETGAAGKLDLFARRDRMFRLLAIDLAGAVSADLQESSELVLSTGAGQITWSVTDQGVERKVRRAGGADLRQRLSSEPAEFGSRGAGLVSLRLPVADLWRVVALPEGRPE